MIKNISRLCVAFMCVPTLAFANVEVDWSVLGGAPQTYAPQVQPTQPQYPNLTPIVKQAESLTTPKTEAVPAEPQTALWGAKWSGRANVGATVQSGNSETEALELDAETTAKWDKHRATAKAEYEREEDNDIKTTDNKSLKLEGDYFYKPKWFANANAEFEQDDIARLDLRSSIGLGLGHQLYDQDDLKLKYIFGPNYLSEETADGESESSLAYNWRFDYEQKFWDGLITLYHNHRILVPADETSSYLVDTNSGVRVPLQKKLVATFEIEHDIDKGAPEGTSEDDTKYGLKLGYEW